MRRCVCVVCFDPVTSAFIVFRAGDLCCVYLTCSGPVRSVLV